ncbi:MAG: type IX secretion system plug protein domain-containing protein, partial [Psychroflexus salarius]
PYTNYKLDIPNQNTRAITKTGNYMLIIKNVNDNIIFSRKFIVYSSDVDIQTTIREDRRLDKTDSHQVVNFEIGRKGYIFRNPNETVNVAVIQNNDFSTGIFNLKPQYTTGNTLIYRYNEKSSFKGGNEFLNFDSKDVRAGTSQIRSIELSDIYESFLFTDFDRSNSVYTFNPDINGNFKINTIQGNDISREADYTRVHFKLQTPQNLKDGEVHIYGQFNNYMLTDDTMMTYNSRTNLYEGSFELKQGFYNYKYVYFTNEGEFINNIASGNFAQTENLYTVIVYYRPIGGRFDEVIGMSNIISRNIKN